MTDPARPEFAGPLKVAADWLLANGVDELLPNHPEITITLNPDGTGTLTHASYNWNGPRGWDGNNIAWPDDDTGATRTLPLVAMPSEEVRRALDATGCMLIVEDAPEQDGADQ